MIDAHSSEHGMASVSKPLFGKISHVDCSKIAHPWSATCGNGFLYMWWSSFIGSAKFLVLIYVAQYLMKRKKFTIEHIKETLLHYFRESLFGACMGSTFVTSMCFFRNSLQRFSYYFLALFPAFVGGIAIFLVDSSRRGFSTTTFQYLALEAMYKYLQRIGIVTNSSLTETLGFMACSSCLLYMLRAGHHLNLRTLMWFFTPPSVKLQTTTDSSPCPHEGECRSYIVSSSLKYFGLGFTLQMVRNIVKDPRQLILHPTSLFSCLLSLDTYLLGIFTGGYALSYKLINCFLCQWLGKDSPLYAIPAGFIAGSFYAVQPNLPIVLIALANLLKVTSQYLTCIGVIPNYPWEELSFMVCSGLLFHVRTMHPQICPKQAIRLMSTMTGTRADDIYTAFKKNIDIVRFL
ncbi:hypothetical protein LSTR_LSTR008826 [Laodelphax striatellus]|uniref:Transmembrane protein 135 N-terminal domain-containing protein n=1 Tax=Laodelphax striatellus TaxID=195883 RepID=A0A482WRV1_LAOST|nr:hypothetical protein LSTR_LSTR008826 [Laodelphax striatellus]